MFSLPGDIYIYIERERFLLSLVGLVTVGLIVTLTLVLDWKDVESFVQSYVVPLCVMCCLCCVYDFGQF